MYIFTIYSSRLAHFLCRLLVHDRFTVDQARTSRHSVRRGAADDQQTACSSPDATRRCGSDNRSSREFSRPADRRRMEDCEQTDGPLASTKGFVIFPSSDHAPHLTAASHHCSNRAAWWPPSPRVDR